MQYKKYTYSNEYELEIFLRRADRVEVNDTSVYTHKNKVYFSWHNCLSLQGERKEHRVFFILLSQNVEFFVNNSFCQVGWKVGSFKDTSTQNLHALNCPPAPFQDSPLCTTQKMDINTWRRDYI